MWAWHLLKAKLARSLVYTCIYNVQCMYTCESPLFVLFVIVVINHYSNSSETIITSLGWFIIGGCTYIIHHWSCNVSHSSVVWFIFLYTYNHYTDFLLTATCTCVCILLFSSDIHVCTLQVQPVNTVEEIRITDIDMQNRWTTLERNTALLQPPDISEVQCTVYTCMCMRPSI